MSTVILYRYPGSPFANKVEHVLRVKGIKYSTVKVASIWPRPELLNDLGLNYRRIPVLTIGNDVYCDTGLIASALERRFPAAQGYGTLYPPRKDGTPLETGLIQAFAKYYAEGPLFTGGAALIPWDKLPEAFINDRSDFLGSKISPASQIAAQRIALSEQSSRVALVENQLSESQSTWLLNTESPSLADISLFFVLDWIRTLPAGATLLDDRVPFTVQWMKRMTEYLDGKKQSTPTTLDHLEAARTITSSPYDDANIGIDAVEAERLQVKTGDLVSIAPTDTGRKHATQGKLVGLNREEAIIEITNPQGTIRAHFPRPGFVVRPVPGTKL